MANALRDLIKALEIFEECAEKGSAFTDISPTHCEHDVLMVTIDPELVPEERRAELDDLGFFIGSEYGEDMFMSYRFGSA